MNYIGALNSAKGGDITKGFFMEGNANKKLEHVTIKTPSIIEERRDEIKLSRTAAERIIARYLRGHRCSPGEANDLASDICNGMIASMSTPVRPGLRGYRMIPEHPPYDTLERLGGQFRTIRIQENVSDIARGAWGLVYAYGENLPDDIVV